MTGIAPNVVDSSTRPPDEGRYGSTTNGARSAPPEYFVLNWLKFLAYERRVSRKIE